MIDDTPSTTRELPSRLSNTEEAALMQKRAALSQRLAVIDAYARLGVERDSAERAVKPENANVLNEIARATREELASVDAELARLKRTRDIDRRENWRNPDDR